MSIVRLLMCHALFALPALAYRNIDDDAWLESEVDYLAKLGSRRTGSPTHNQLIDHIQEQLEALGLEVHTDVLTFEYDDVPLTPGSLSIDGKDITVSSSLGYSGHTPAEGVDGPLVNLIGPSNPPDWAKAAEGIAVVNMTNTAIKTNAILPVWPGSPEWPEYITGVPCLKANNVIKDLDRARDAGVKGVVYVWENITDGLAAGLYAPFHNLFFDLPGVYVSGEAAQSVVAASDNNTLAKLTLAGKLVADTPTRSIWVVIPGTERPEESILINTHTDGTNVLEENGHIAMLQYARSLVASPPRRATILVFVTAHIHSAPFSDTKRSTTRWMLDNQEVWNGTAPTGTKTVFASCVEHLGAVAWKEDFSDNSYTPTSEPEPEILYAATPELAALLYREWRGAEPNVTRVVNPNEGMDQAGEGLPLLQAGIPEISKVTSPAWLLNEYPEDFDEWTLIDIDVLKRQVDGFVRVWREADGMESEAFGVVRPRI